MHRTCLAYGQEKNLYFFQHKLFLLQQLFTRDAQSTYEDQLVYCKCFPKIAAECRAMVQRTFHRINALPPTAVYRYEYKSIDIFI